MLDFYCPKLKFAIEVDGPTHLSDDEIIYDKHRQEEIENLGIQFLRFWNNEVYDDMYNVLEKIKAKIKELQYINLTVNSPDGVLEGLLSYKSVFS